MQRYNYVIFQKSSDYYRISYSDLHKRDDVLYSVCKKTFNSHPVNKFRAPDPWLRINMFQNFHRKIN